MRFTGTSYCFKHNRERDFTKRTDASSTNGTKTEDNYTSFCTLVSSTGIIATGVKFSESFIKKPSWIVIITQ